MTFETALNRRRASASSGAQNHRDMTFETALNRASERAPAAARSITAA
ncbi:hypothetical protein [Nannocystis exedens]|nr:hypothetical protein [Nannocystis exedens]